MLVALPAMTNAPPAVAFAARLVVHIDDETDGLSRFVVHVSLRVPHGMTVARARRGRGDTLRLSWDDGTLRLAARPPTRGLLGEPASVRRTARLDARRFP